MSVFVLDTNVVLGIVRSQVFTQFLERSFSFGQPANIFAISAVTIGEIKSLGLQRKWGKVKISAHLSEINKLLIIPINSSDIFDRYAEIDAFSQGKLKGKPLPLGMSSRNMGKNDLWIAATASVLNAKLMTSDRDFDHLHHQFIDVAYVTIS